jgi:DNA primase
VRPADLDPTDRELVQVLLNHPAAVGRVVSRVPVGSLADGPLRAILRACYDLHGEGALPSFERVSLRLDDPRARALAAGLLLPLDPAPMPEVPSGGPQAVAPAPWEVRLDGILARVEDRDRRGRARSVQAALKEVDRDADPETYRALQTELFRLLTQRPDTKAKNAS